MGAAIRPGCRRPCCDPRQKGDYVGKTKLPLLKQNRTILSEKLKESLSSVLPVTGIVFLLCFSISPVPNSLLMGFVLGAFLLILGMGLFTLGTDMAMTPIGSHVGSAVTKSRRVWLIILVSLLVGIFITMSEPDLQVLAEQVPGIPNMVLIVAVAIGVGVFLVVAMLRMLLRVKLSYLLIGIYVFVFLLARFVPREFLSVAFDSGGVTTGPMTVPFIMALGLGVTAIRSDSNAENDSFGLVALCSVGPILAVLLLGIVYGAGTGEYVPVVIPELTDSRELSRLFLSSLPKYIEEVALALCPILVFFVLFQIAALRLKKGELIKIGVGLGYTYIGLVLFLTGVNVGFMPVGNYIGQIIGGMAHNWIIVPIGVRAGRSRAEQAGPYDHRRRHPAEGPLHQPFDRRRDFGGARHAAHRDRPSHHVPAGPRLPDRRSPHLFLPPALYRHRLRLGRRGLRPHDRHLPAAPCDGDLQRRGRQRGGGRLRRRGHGGDDPADHHPAAGRLL